MEVEGYWYNITCPLNKAAEEMHYGYKVSMFNKYAEITRSKVLRVITIEGWGEMKVNRSTEVDVR